ncbi:MAG: alpha/beta fold hydrolase, partial [Candidatus Competibacterales bacterium]|nr:alpha/beta fold hydrolase [Candidatus Competibacterales bacterium]
MLLRTAEFRPPWWLRGAHAQTLWPALLRPRPPLVLRRERLELADGDFLDLDWCGGDTGPLVMVLHGLEGSSDSGYARGLLAAATRRGWRGVVLQSRGCSGTPNRLAKSYCAGDTGDLEHVVGLLRRREPHAPLAVVGYSLGANVLLKWLGEQSRAVELAAAVAVSVPFLLERAARRLGQGLSRFYQWYLLRACKASYRAKFAYRDDAPVAPGQLRAIRDF